MAVRYIANTPAEQREMLGTIGAASIEDLLVKIPPKARLSRPLALPPALAESDLVRHLRALAGTNADADGFVSLPNVDTTVMASTASPVMRSRSRLLKRRARGLGRLLRGTDQATMRAFCSACPRPSEP